MNSYQLYARLLKYVLPYWKALALSFVLMTLLAATEPLFPAMMKPLLDEGLTKQDPAYIQWIPIALAALFLLKGILSFTASYASSWVSNHLVTDIRNDIFKHMIHLPTYFFDTNSSGKVSTRVVHHVNGVTTAATQTLTVLVRDSLTITGLIAWLLWLDSHLTLITLLMFPVIAYIILFFNKRLRKVVSEAQRINEGLTHIAEESCSNNRIVKISNAEQFEIEKFSRQNNQQRQYSMKTMIAEGAVTPIIQLLVALSISIILAISLNSNSTATSSAGGFMSFLTALMLLLPPIKRLTGITSVIQRGLAAAESIFSLIDEPAERKHHDTNNQLINKGDIQLNNVTFSYPESSNPALDAITLTIHPGQHVALVGQSGSGKTTITSLLSGFYDLEDGQIEIDGIDINRLTLKALRESISLVSQDVRLFDDTISYNVSYGDRQPNPTRVEEALRAAYAWDFVQKHQAGVQMQVGQNGIRLSGGQRQRIAIARAFYKDSPILILDEATSALDTESEKQIQAALIKLMEKRTTIMIAHRLSTIQHADQIIVMDHGKISEQGTHQELIEKGGLYSHYHQLQFSKLQ